jgi:hypothetical protein
MRGGPMLEILYWLLVAALGYVVVGYYWHMLLLARIRSRPWRKAAPPVLPMSSSLPAMKRPGFPNGSRTFLSKNIPKIS